MTERVRLPMVCHCGDIGKGPCLIDEVKERLSAGSEELSAHEVTDANLLTSIVTSLQWDHSAHITEIRNDQWSGVTAQTNDGELEMYVECDQVEHGIAAIWKAFADR